MEDALKRRGPTQSAPAGLSFAPDRLNSPGLLLMRFDHIPGPDYKRESAARIRSPRLVRDSFW
jgi:hypothetical protein